MAEPMAFWKAAAGHTVTRVSEYESVDAAAVPDRVLDELAEVLIDRLDQLLDRLTDRALAAPTPGSAARESEWCDRETETGRARARERMNHGGCSRRQPAPRPM